MLKHRKIVFICLVFFILLLSINANKYFYLVLFLFWLSLTTWGVFDIRLSYFIKSYCNNKDVNEKEIAITFDDGPHEMTENALDILKAYNVKATFFCIGNKIEERPLLFKRMIEEDHVVANHSYSHSNFLGFFTTRTLVEEIEKTNEIIKHYLGKKPVFYRPPFGVTNPRIARAVKLTKQIVIGWNVRSLDTVIKDEKKVFERVKNKITPGSIILFHDTSEKTVRVLERLLLFLQEENYTIVTVDKLLKIEAYET